MSEKNRIKPVTPARRSLIFRLTVVYSAFTIINLLFLWITTGSRQMQLVLENALSSSELVAARLSGKLQGNLNTKMFKSLLSNSPERTAIAEALIDALSKEPFLVEAKETLVLTNRGEKIAGFGSNYVRPETLQLVIKAFQEKEKGNMHYILEPDLTNYQLRYVLPLAWTAGEGVALYVLSELPGIREQLAATYRLAYTLIGVILAVQFLFGIYLYRTILKPITLLSEASREVTEGNLQVKVPYSRYHDELHQLARDFNQMTATLHEKAEKLHQSIAVLEEKDHIHQIELELARSIQEGIIPRGEIISPEFEVAVEYRPLHQVSGDYYDFFRLPDNSIALLIADASGHGVPAAFITIMARMFFQTRVNQPLPPAKLFYAVNQLLTKTITTPNYLTAAYLIVLPNGNTCYSNAAHPPPLLLKKNGDIWLLKTDGFFLGAMHPPPYSYTEGTIKLEAGDILLLYTDGITEAENDRGEAYGQKRLVELISQNRGKNPHEIKNAVLESLSKYMGNRPAFDDTTLIVAQYLGCSDKAAV